jgi:hypothetical protein
MMGKYMGSLVGVRILKVIVKYSRISWYPFEKNASPGSLMVLLVWIVMILSLLVGCEDHFLGLGPQPRYLETPEYEPKLNIFGVLRPDTLSDLAGSFVHLERTYPFNLYADSTIIPDAEVKLYKYQDSLITDTIPLFFTDEQSKYPFYEYRDANFYPDAGVTYGVFCHRDGYPDLTSTTRVPTIPVIEDNSLKIDNQKLSFIIQPDSQVGLYDVYLTIGEKVYQKRVRRSESGNIVVDIELSEAPTGTGFLIIYGYDVNLSEYITYNINIKPNTYRYPYTTVDNGYGCFGSLNVCTLSIRF